MQPTTCSRCSSWTESPTETLKFLKGEYAICEECPRKAMIETVRQQFKSNHSKWWVVNGVVVVPVWIKEQLHSVHYRIGLGISPTQSTTRSY